MTLYMPHSNGFLFAKTLTPPPCDVPSNQARRTNQGRGVSRSRTPSFGGVNVVSVSLSLCLSCKAPVEENIAGMPGLELGMNDGCVEMPQYIGGIDYNDKPPYRSSSFPTFFDVVRKHCKKGALLTGHPDNMALKASAFPLDVCEVWPHSLYHPAPRSACCRAESSWWCYRPWPDQGGRQRSPHSRHYQKLLIGPSSPWPPSSPLDGVTLLAHTMAAVDAG
ncbi:hypothetical protein B0H67DRAFT_570984 [Lasiosphaeris hirsuta]|uniref:Uncharacterized protein n=1 Tax=Lasiosphaeris hirsuta TaxID=260670 RepID=A0AA40B0Y1_9PEZI|nr:hypothetical protein B0H67DRAFT_570984 [Lasiosphaeris hirsuta]